MSKVVCKTLMCNDGVLGLNGYQYLLDDEDNEMEFDSKEDAVARYKEVKNNGRFLIYAVCHPECRSMSVSLPIKV